MKILIETNCEEDKEKVKNALINFCEDNFKQSKVYIDNELQFDIN